MQAEYEGGEGGGSPPEIFGQLRFFGQQEEIWARPVFKDVSFFYYYYFEEINIFYFNLGVIIKIQYIHMIQWLPIT